MLVQVIKCEGNRCHEPCAHELLRLFSAILLFHSLPDGSPIPTSLIARLVIIIIHKVNRGGVGGFMSGRLRKRKIKKTQSGHLSSNQYISNACCIQVIFLEIMLYKKLFLFKFFCRLLTACTILMWTVTPLVYTAIQYRQKPVQDFENQYRQPERKNERYFAERF